MTLAVYSKLILSPFRMETYQNMDIQNYLNRIEIYTDLQVNLSSLRLIQRQHLLRVPFENLDIHLNKNLIFDLESLYNKIVIQKRGGICYELNWLLYHLLVDIGFNVRVLGGKVLEHNGTYFDHMLLVVDLNSKEYLVDVGFGDNFLEPLAFDIGYEQNDQKGLFKISQIDESHFELKKFSDEINDFITEYTFENAPKKIEDFQSRIDYFIHNEDSIFKKNLFCSLEMENGRRSLKQDKFILTQNGSVNTSQINSPAQYIEYLTSHFEISLNEIEQGKISIIQSEMNSN